MIRNVVDAQIQYESVTNGKGQKSNISLTEARKSAMMRLMSYSFKSKFIFFWAIISLFLSTIALVSIPYIIGKIINSISDSSSFDRQSQLNYYCILFIIISAIGSFFAAIRGYTFQILGEMIVLHFRNDLFTKIIAHDIEFFDNNRSGELISRLTSDITLLQSASGETISVLIRNVVQFIVSIVFLFFISWKLTLAFLSMLPLFGVVAYIFMNLFKELTKQQQQRLSISTQIAQETIQNIRVVRSFSMEDEEDKIFRSSTQQAFQIGKKKSALIGLFSGLGMFVGQLGIMVVMWFGGYLVIQNEMNIGDLSSFVLYTMTLAGILFILILILFLYKFQSNKYFLSIVSIVVVSGMINLLLTAAAVSEKLFQIMDEKIKIVNGKYVTTGQGKINGSIQISDITFQYPSKQNVQVMKKLSLKIEPGAVIGFVGHSGSGKSTIINLLQRFYDPTEGEIYFDGIDLKNYDLRFLHKQIGFVPQEPTLFSGSILDNIKFGKRDATDEQIIQAMKQAHAYEFISNKDNFPEGLDTIVGERGIKLSGGQKQRIAIARALIKDPSILIFDEATSALDAESEYQVQSAIEEIMKKGQVTILIIAHRLSTIINCQCIAVLENGSITELGTHNELLRLNGVYKSLIERQLSGKL